MDGQQFALRGFEDSTALRDFPAFAFQRLLEPVRLAQVLRADDARRGVHAQEDSAERTEEGVRVVRLHVVHGQTLGAEDYADACGSSLHDDFAESAHGASYRIVRRADGRIVVGQLDVPVRVLRGLAGLLKVGVEFVEHDVDGFRVGKLFLIELAFVEVVDAADTIPAEQFHPLCHLVA